MKEEMVEIIYKNQQQIMKYKPTNFTKTIEELDKCSIVVNRYYTYLFTMSKEDNQQSRVDKFQLFLNIHIKMR